MAHRIEEEYNKEYDDDDPDLTEEFAAEQMRNNPPLTSEKRGEVVEIFPLTVEVIKPQASSVLERMKALGNDAVYVLQDLLLDPEVSDRVRLDAVKVITAMLEAEQNKELKVETEGAADLDELEQLLRDGGFEI